MGNSMITQEIFFNFLKLGWNTFGENFVGSYVSQVIKYAHNGLKSDFDIFGIPEVIEIQ